MSSSAYPPPVYRPREPAPAFNPWWIRLPILVVTGGMLFGLIVAVALGAFQVLYSGRIVPNVRAYGIDLGGMTPLQAVEALDAAFTYDDSTVFTFRDSAGVWQASARELGVSLDAQATAARAFAVGHGQGFVSNLADQALAWLNGVDIAPEIRYDQAAALRFLQGIAAGIDRAPTEATLVIRGTDVQAAPGAIGRSLDLTTTLAALDSAILSLRPGGELPLMVRETLPVTPDTRAAADKARVALSAPIVLTADDGSGAPLGPWTIPVSQIEALLRIDTLTAADGTQSLDVQIDTAVYRPSLEALAPGLVRPAENARFHFDQGTGQLVNVLAAVQGRRLNVDATLVRIAQAAFDPANRTVAMVFDMLDPQYPDSITAAQLGITELVSEGVSYYAGSSEARRSNISTAISRFDGLIIAPGEEFSFNRFVGDISPEEGFVEGFVIMGDRTVRGVGGGVCQVSTTAFRAAFYAGYPITERWAHGYRVGYYEAGDPEGVGMDAAIFTPDLDFRFINDTDYHLLIEAFIDPTTASVHFRFYSTNPGRLVTRQPAEITGVQPPAPTSYVASDRLQPDQQLQVDWPAEGAYVRVLRVITDLNGVELRREYIASQYQPWGAVVQVAPGDPRLN